MKKTSKITVLMLGALIILGSGFVSAAPQAVEKPVDMKKIYLEIAGDYDFDMQGQSMIVNFFEREGKLFGYPPGETPEEIVPVKGENPLKFEVTISSNGQYFELEFARNENKEITRCTLKAQGMEILGIKLAK